jgi:signal transduction histidine kinase
MGELDALLAECQDELVESWLSFYEPGPSERKGTAAGQRLRSSLERLRVALKGALAEASSDPTVATKSEETDASAVALDAVAAARAYGALQGWISDRCAAQDVEMSPAEHRALAAWTTGAVAEVIAEERGQREEESRRIAHELRNPLGSALMALNLLRPRLSSSDEARLADTLERNLKRLERIINEKVARERTTEST